MAEQRQSFFKGVNWDRVERKWRARITRKGLIPNDTRDLGRCGLRAFQARPAISW